MLHKKTNRAIFSGCSIARKVFTHDGMHYENAHCTHAHSKSVNDQANRLHLLSFPQKMDHNQRKFSKKEIPRIHQVDQRLNSKKFHLLLPNNAIALYHFHYNTLTPMDAIASEKKC